MCLIFLCHDWEGHWYPSRRLFWQVIKTLSWIGASSQRVTDGPDDQMWFGRFAELSRRFLPDSRRANRPSIMWELMSRIIVELKARLQQNSIALHTAILSIRGGGHSFFTLRELYWIWKRVKHPNRNWEEQTWNLKHKHKNMYCNIMQTCHPEMDVGNKMLWKK